MSDTVHIPQEDSFLLAGVVKKYARGKVLDMGTGSGIQGITAIENKKDVTSITFVDINPEAIKYVKQNFQHVNSSFIVSDLFKNIKDKYDTIIFNPPYLPEDDLDNEKLITTGGKHGYELISKFLKQASNHLNIDGQILLLFSSLTKKGEIDRIIKSLNYSKNLVAKENLFMEQLYVYQLKLINENIIKGHRGIVEIKGNIAIKRSFTEHYNANEEAKFLKILNKKGIGPKYLSNKKDELKMEYVKGDRIIDYLKKANKTQIVSMLSKILNQLFIMDSLKINKLELTNPYKHIIVRRHQPVLIDFERCIYTQKPKNVTQFIQFLCSGHLKGIITLDDKKFRDLAVNYKKNMSKSNLKTIISNLNT